MFFKFSVKVVRYGLKRVSPLLFEVKKKKKVELFLDLNEATTRYRRFLRLKKSKIDPPYCVYICELLLLAVVAIVTRAI